MATLSGPATPKRGNCSDFHSLFIGLARAAGHSREIRNRVAAGDGQTERRYQRLSLLGGILFERLRLGFRSTLRKRGKIPRERISSSARWTRIGCNSASAATSPWPLRRPARHSTISSIPTSKWTASRHHITKKFTYKNLNANPTNRRRPLTRDRWMVTVAAAEIVALVAVPVKV